MVQHWFGATLKFRDDALCQNFAELNPPLVEGINVPKDTLREDGVLVKSHQFAQRFWIERLGECDEVARDKPRTLMNQLVKRVLSVCARFAPVDRTSVARDSFPIEG